MVEMRPSVRKTNFFAYFFNGFMYVSIVPANIDWKQDDLTCSPIVSTSNTRALIRARDRCIYASTFIIKIDCVSFVFVFHLLLLLGERKSIYFYKYE